MTDVLVNFRDPWPPHAVRAPPRASRPRSSGHTPRDLVGGLGPRPLAGRFGHPLSFRVIFQQVAHDIGQPSQLVVL